MEAAAGVNRILMVSGTGTRRSRKCSFNIRVKNAGQRAGIPGMRQRRMEAPSEVDQSTVVNGAVARRSRLLLSHNPLIAMMRFH
ncbi:hypothetical protein D6J78_12615 [Salmonella enterica subsp. enterica serovar Abaetetuba]|nr:hypothetical protein [Salmonella enterica subsp. enterica serovar Abaetetuba]ECD1969223.1 hypothetical protein [Salmonella enterica subsp. enterica serovar Abaetetuba]